MGTEAIAFSKLKRRFILLLSHSLMPLPVLQNIHATVAFKLNFRWFIDAHVVG